MKIINLSDRKQTKYCDMCHKKLDKNGYVNGSVSKRKVVNDDVIFNTSENKIFCNRCFKLYENNITIGGFRKGIVFLFILFSLSIFGVYEMLKIIIGWF